MRIRNFTLCLLMSVLLSGCAAQSERSSQMTGEMTRRYAEEDRQILEQNRAAIQAASQEEIKQLRAENTSLKEAKAKAESNEKRLSGFLGLNDAVQEHKDELMRGMQETLEPKEAELFKSMGGSGQVEDFKVEDVFLYKGYLAVNVIFVWSNPDASGGVGRGFVALDPDRAFEISDCEMVGQRLVSAQEFASLNKNNETQIQQEAPATQQLPDPDAFKVTNATKNGLLLIGAGVLAHLAETYFDNNQQQ